MITIKKLGSNEYGTWCVFQFKQDNLIINGIAKTKLDNLKEEHTYANLSLIFNQKNGKISFFILKNEE